MILKSTRNPRSVHLPGPLQLTLVPPAELHVTTGSYNEEEVSKKNQWELWRTQEIDTSGSVSLPVDFKGRFLNFTVDFSGAGSGKGIYCLVLQVYLDS